MSRLKRFIFFFLLTGSLSINAQNISNFKPFIARCQISPLNQNFIILRQFKIGFHSHYLMVNPENLLTQIRPAEGLLLYEENWETLRQEFQNTPYFKALADAQTHANLLLDLRQSLMEQEKTRRERDFFSS